MTAVSKTAATFAARDDIAIVGLAAHVPGADSAAAFWTNLRDGVESITVFDEAQLIAAGERPDTIARRNYVPAGAPMQGFDLFDADFFGFSPKEAAILDPQHRKFLEVAWTAMEDAGHLPEDVAGKIGVYAGCGMGSYFYFNICSNPDLVRDVGMFLLRHTGNDKDFLCTRVSHVFDLKGPSVNIQTACSTSLVAVHHAVRALRAGDCDMALAGGVTIELPQGRGYLFRENEILSPDGHCHAFDHRAEGTVFGSGAGAVVLRRLSDALADGDRIYAVIKGTAINNDGAAKAGYLAPSVDGQAAAVRAALDDAQISADSIGYVECHGTGTYLGDPIEVSALTQAYARDTDRRGFCRIGSVKTNIGHLDTAAGVAGLIKTTLALKNGAIPPSLGYEKPNPAIDFDTSPFRVNDRLTDWPQGPAPRRAGVNALGVGGTNAHAILEEAPSLPPSDDSDWPFQILTISGRSRAALDANTAALAAHLRARPDQPLADVAFTLKEGRRAFDKRRVVVAETHAEAAALLDAADPRRVFTHDALGDDPDVVFMFPGGGAQYAGMARDLYETEPVFAEWMDRGLDHLQAQVDHDIRALWLAEGDAKAEANRRLQQPSVQLPLILIVEYALAKLWEAWGVTPSALIGHSMGENAAACVAGVMRFEDCIDLVLLRGRLFDTVPKGGMLSVNLPEDALRPLIGRDLDIASVNAPELCAVSGPQAALDRLSADLTARGVEHQRIAIDIAAHSRMLDPILADFRAFLQGLTLQAPRLPVISNRTGQPLTDAQATDPEYWVQQLRQTVLFAEGLAHLSKGAPRVFLEVGPGRALSALAQINPGISAAQVVSTLRHPDHAVADDLWFLTGLARLWACGVKGDWTQVWGDARRRRVGLPTYAFQRSRYFIEPGKAVAADETPPLRRTDDIADWGWRPEWRPAYAPCAADALDPAVLSASPLTWLFFADETGLADASARRLRAAGHRVVTVVSGDGFAQLGEDRYSLAPEEGADGVAALFDALREAAALPDRIGHFWLVTGTETFRPGSSFFDRNLQHGFHSLLHLTQALGQADMTPPVVVVTSGAAQVAGEGLPYPEKAMIAGPAGVAPRELPGLTIATLDLSQGMAVAEATDAVLEDLLADPSTRSAALRNGRRFERGYAARRLDAAEAPRFKAGGTYLITGGLGGMGLTLARRLVTDIKARVVLLGRAPLPPRADWADTAARRRASPRTRAAIAAIEAMDPDGTMVLTLAADTCNLAEMRAARDTAEAAFGKITGVLHAAGRIDDAPLLSKTDAAIDAVFAPKVTGLRVLDALFPDGALDLLVLFSSSSTATTPAGQVDYVAANAYLNAVAQARRGGATQVVAINWGVWAETGMAARAMAERMGAAGDDAAPVDAALLSRVHPIAGGQRFEADIAPDHWVFDDHRTADGQALLPGTGYLELIAEAAAAQGIATPYEVRDLYFYRPVAAAETDRRVAVDLIARDGGFAADLRSDARLGTRSGLALNAQAQVVPLARAAQRPHIDPRAIAKRCTRSRSGTPEARLASPQEAHLAFGPRWHVLQSMTFGAGEGLARLCLPDIAAGDPDAGFRLHPALLDLATGWAMELIPGYSGDALWVPLSYGAVRVHRALPSDILSWARLSSGDQASGEAVFDVTLCDAAGAVIVEVTGFRMRRLDRADMVGHLPALREADMVFDTDAGGAAPLSPAEERLLHATEQGIRPAEGPQALVRALATGLPEIVVTALPLPALIAEAATADQPAAEDGAGFDRPDLDTAYVAPQNPVEEALAALWRKLLGVSQVGTQDSFFDLGGHSLIAVRLFASIKREFGAEFPISALFEAPTIAALAGLVAEATGRSLDAAPTADAAPAAPARPRFRHLVALQKDGDRAPVFIVAGMFGNVLNLRQLAIQIGTDRPVYGLQARGLVGSEDPHTTIEAAAADYLAEIRQVQPQGPYLLGGFSGGGITAYEMAQQLKAAGQQVGLLALLDTPMPVRPPLTRADKAVIKLAEFRRKGPAYLREWLQNRRDWAEEQRRQDQAAPQGAASFNNRKIELAFREAVGAYALAPWDGPLTLFRPPLDRHWQVTGGRWVSAAREYVLHDNDWTPWAPRTEVIEVPGDHDSMVLSPNVAVLAARLREVIAAGEGDLGASPAHVSAAE